MEKIWSPWRSVYIDSFAKSEEENKCVFCAASTEIIGRENSLLIYKGKTAFVIMNLYPYNNGHLMIVPKNHKSSFSDLTSEERNEVMELTDLAIRALTKLYKPHGFNFGANIGRAAGAGIDQHLHFHIVPRWNGDTNFMPVLGEVKVISHELIKTRDNLITIFGELVKNENSDSSE